MAKKDFKTPTGMFLTETQPASKEEKKPIKRNEKPQAKADPQQEARQLKKVENIPQGYKLEKETKSKRLQLLIRPYTHEQLKEIATKKETSLNELINSILETYLAERK